MLVEIWRSRQRDRRSRSVWRSRPHGECEREDLRGWWFVAERFMRPDCVEVAPPAFNEYLSLPQSVEDFAIEQFIAQAVA